MSCYRNVCLYQLAYGNLVLLYVVLLKVAEPIGDISRYMLLKQNA